MLVASGSYQRLYGGLTTRERGRGQFLQARQAEALQEQFRCREAQAAVCTGKFLHKLEISERHDEPALVGIEETVDFRLADWLPKGDAGEHFERRGRETRNLVRVVLFAQIVSQGLVVDFGSEKRNHSVDNSQLKAHKGELTVRESSAVINSTLLSAATAHIFCPHLFAVEFLKLFSQSVHRKAPVEKRNCTTVLAAISPSRRGQGKLKEKIPRSLLHRPEAARP